MCAEPSRHLQMGADLERVQRERDAALARLTQQSSSSETMQQELEAGRKQLRRVEVCEAGNVTAHMNEPCWLR